MDLLPLCMDGKSLKYQKILSFDNINWGVGLYY